MIELSKLIPVPATRIKSVVNSIRSLKDIWYIGEHCIQVNRLENLANNMLAHADTGLLKTSNAIAIIKLKNICEHLETATGNCGYVANTLSDIAIRHS